MVYPGELRKELVEMAAVDQRLRHEILGEYAAEADLHATLQTLQDVDRAHAERAKEIVDTHGWPRLTEDGAEACSALWLLVQHADHDPGFQRRCLDLMTEAADAGEADRELWATLTHRVLLKELGLQPYGTQWATEPSTGEQVPATLMDPERVDDRRAQLGLDSLNDYKRRTAQLSHHRSVADAASAAPTPT